MNMACKTTSGRFSIHCVFIHSQELLLQCRVEEKTLVELYVLSANSLTG